MKRVPPYDVEKKIYFYYQFKHKPGNEIARRNDQLQFN